jgi:hypothetical protein
MADSKRVRYDYDDDDGNLYPPTTHANPSRTDKICGVGPDHFDIKGELFPWHVEIPTQAIVCTRKPLGMHKLKTSDAHSRPEKVEVAHPVHMNYAMAHYFMRKFLEPMMYIGFNLDYDWSRIIRESMDRWVLDGVNETPEVETFGLENPGSVKDRHMTLITQATRQLVRNYWGPYVNTRDYLYFDAKLQAVDGTYDFTASQSRTVRPIMHNYNHGRDILNMLAAKGVVIAQRAGYCNTMSPANPDEFEKAWKIMEPYVNRNGYHRDEYLFPGNRVVIPQLVAGSSFAMPSLDATQEYAGRKLSIRRFMYGTCVSSRTIFAHRTSKTKMRESPLNNHVEICQREGIEVCFRLD